MKIDCVVLEWGAWTVNAITGTSTRRRAIKQVELNGGRPCPKTFETEEGKDHLHLIDHK